MATVEVRPEIADGLEPQPIDKAARGLVWLQDSLAKLQRESARIFE